MIILIFQFEELLNYLESKDLLDSASIAESKANIRSNLEWIESRKQSVDHWLGSLQSSNENKPSGAILVQTTIYLVLASLLIVHF